MGVSFLDGCIKQNFEKVSRKIVIVYPKRDVVEMFSKRVLQIPYSGTVKLGNIVSELKSKGVEIISFTIGEPDFPTPPHIVAAAEKALREGYTHYSHSKGILELRRAIAEKYIRENGMDVTPENILVTPAKHAIFMGIFSIIEEGDEVILSDPAWVSYEPCIRLAGGIPKKIKTTPENEFKLLPDEIEKNITSKSKMLILNSPNNPTGCVLTKKELEKIAEIVERYNLIVLSDEVYEKIVYDVEHCSIASFENIFENTITVSGFSKTYAMTGWRLGWLLASDRIICQIEKIQQHSITCATTFVQRAGVAALESSQECVEKMRLEFKKRRDFVIKRINEIDGLECTTPKGAFYVFPTFKLKNKDMNSEEFAEFLLKEGVAVTPGSAFGNGGEGFIRISYATSMKNLEEGFEKIESAMSKV